VAGAVIVVAQPQARQAPVRPALVPEVQAPLEPVLQDAAEPQAVRPPVARLALRVRAAAIGAVAPRRALRGRRRRC
jgi:hypothetical protein